MKETDCSDFLKPDGKYIALENLQDPSNLGAVCRSAEALGLEKRSVDGIFTSAIQRKGLGVRTPAEIELDDGTHKAVKFLSLTPAGMSFDPDATDED